jgi:hypothetical protein
VSDQPFYTPNRLPAPPRVRKPGELLFEFVRASDRATMSCELRFHGESYGWEVQFFERGDFLYGHGAFVLRAQAVQWAEEERTAMERTGGEPGN